MPKDVKGSPVETGAPVVEGAVVEKKEGDVRFKGCHSRAKMGVKRAMKKVLKCARKGRLARRALVKEVAEILGDATPSDLGDVVDGKVKSSRRFKMSKGRVVLLRAD